MAMNAYRIETDRFCRRASSAVIGSVSKYPMVEMLLYLVRVLSVASTGVVGLRLADRVE